MNIKKLLRSSANPEKLSLTLKSISVLVLSLAPVLGLDIQSTDLDNGIASIVSIVASIGVLYGLGRKLYFALK